MKVEELLKQVSTPLGAPAFPRGPYRFNGREYLNITYRTDIEALRKVVPEPLEIDEPLVRFEVMRMPDTTGLGNYTECGQAVVVRLGQERGEYLHAMYVDSHPAIASGREVSAFPKKLGAPRLYTDSDTLVGTLDYGTLRIAVATMGYKHEALEFEEAKAEICVPTFMLKLMRGYDRKLRICELVRAQIQDIEIKAAFRGPARLQLFEHVLAPMADFPVREVIAASHIVADLSLTPPSVVHDYLAR
ncbi:acetoacetate decarboxylase [Variovorax sp. 770b2]|jgi:acetoacetate decarboxylase|uniref:acetoacetate decarboxylase n=1 Tax=Variovorax sp. 770b2 TaxID=1566271 RepID=UPI0008E2F801|nr:acetoacetate decarboxylase [Variovorax sp. 770b2]SFQ37299.1 acetoacetate decarboxylase [Variovorax sp. 770b2]